MGKALISFGHGYCARALAPHLVARGWTVWGTTRKPEKAAAFEAGLICYPMGGTIDGEIKTFRRLVPTIREMGLLTPRVSDAFEKLKVLDYAAMPMPA